jgi:hypothetical protein
MTSDIKFRIDIFGLTFGYCQKFYEKPIWNIREDKEHPPLSEPEALLSRRP